MIGYFILSFNLIGISLSVRMVCLLGLPQSSLHTLVLIPLLVLQRRYKVNI